MAQLINDTLGKIINITSEATHQAEYKPAADANGQPAPKPSHCNLPDLLDISLTLDLPTITPIKTCDLDFVPFPVIPQLFIPDDLTSPCADHGMTVEMTYIPTDGQTVGINASTASMVTGTSVDFKTVIPTTEGYPLPNITVDFPLTADIVSNNFTIIHGEQYQVYATGENPVEADDYITYESKPYHVGDVFYGKTNTVASKSSGLVGLKQIQTRRVTDVNTSTVNVATPFSIAENKSDLSWTLNRFVVQVDDTRPVNANLHFRQVDPNGCDYQLLGELNLNTPCPEGFAFDSQYNSTATEYLTSNGTGTVTRKAGNTLTDFSTLIPHAVGQPLPILELHGEEATTLTASTQYKVTSGTVTVTGGNTYNEGEYINLAAGGTVTGTGIVRRAYQNYVSSVTEDAVTVLPLPDGAYPASGLESNSWLLNRLVVKNDSGPSTFLYVKDTDDSCSGKLLAEINLPALTVPCKDGTAVTWKVQGGEQLNPVFNYGYSDLNPYTNQEILTHESPINLGNGTTTYDGLASQLNSTNNSGWTNNLAKAPLVFEADNSVPCQTALTVPNMTMYPQIPLFIPGANINMKFGFISNRPAIQIIGTGTSDSGGGSTSAPSCQNCCLWA
jgi:hypothetical protein